MRWEGSLYQSPPAAGQPNLVGQERPPEVGDWIHVHVASYTAIEKVLAVDDSSAINIRGVGTKITTDKKETPWGWTPGQFTIVRRSTDPLRKGDQVAFGSKKGWIWDVLRAGSPAIYVNFVANRSPRVGDCAGRFNREDLTLVEPFYDRRLAWAKGDC